MIEMTTTAGVRYTLSDDGAVIDRTDGPRGWDYSGKWIIKGFSKRHHSRQIIPLADALAGEDVGQGWVHDLDHGMPRMWGGGGRRMKSIRKVAS
jgi:hypothetical protein